MSAHSAQTCSGTSPSPISSANTRQPRHSPSTDSRPAATTSNPSTTSAAVPSPSTSPSTSAAEDIAAPIAWANRFGGPGTGRARPSAGAIRFWAVHPSGLRVGPVRTRAQNPYASGIVSQYQPVINVNALSATTPEATVRAAFSLTGFGNASSARTGEKEYRQLI